MPLRPRWTSIVVTWPQRAFSAKKISDESEITEEWKEVSGRRTTSRSCYYRDSGLVQCVLCLLQRVLYLLAARAAQVCAFFPGRADFGLSRRIQCNRKPPVMSRQ